MKNAVTMSLWCALLGVLVIPLLIGSGVQSPAVLLTFWPTSIVGTGYHGGDPMRTFIIGSIELLGNGFLYGCVGFAIGKWLFLRRHHQ